MAARTLLVMPRMCGGTSIVVDPTLTLLPPGCALKFVHSDKWHN
jgi:hypothetical protein